MERNRSSNYSGLGRICKCNYCGNSLFSVEDENFDLKDSSFFSPKMVVNVKVRKDEREMSGKTELLCSRCGVSLGYKIVDMAGKCGESNHIRVNRLEMSTELKGAA